MKIKDLEKLQHEMSTQDNLATSHPLYCVFEKEYIWGMDPNYSDQYKWIDSDGSEFDLEVYNLTEEIVEDEDSFNAWKVDFGLEQDLSVHKVYYKTVDRFLNAHFTRKAADLYINQNHYNLKSPFVYVMSLYRCHEMIAIQEYFKNLF